MEIIKLIDQQMTHLQKHYRFPDRLRRSHALFLGEERRMALAAEMAPHLWFPLEGPHLREPSEPEWAADNGDGSGYGPIGHYRGFYVFLHDDPHACHFMPMETF